MQPAQLSHDLSRYLTDYVLFDLETTGVSVLKDDIIEISAIRVRNGQITEEFSHLVNPLRPIPMAASMVNHITDDMVADAPTIDQLLPRFLEFIGSDVLVGHNIARFDLKFLNRDLQKHFSATLGNNYVDTLPFARQQIQCSRYSLECLAAYYHISYHGAHRALADCHINHLVYQRLGMEIPSKAPSCPLCGAPLRRRTSRFGPFWGCSGYPACKFTQNIDK